MSDHFDPTEFDDDFDAYLVMQKKLEKAEAELASSRKWASSFYDECCRLREALEWYREKIERLCSPEHGNWTGATCVWLKSFRTCYVDSVALGEIVNDDKGKRARDALSGWQGGQETCSPEPENRLLLRDELRGIEKWQTPDEIVTLGVPADEGHNCDEMGCSSLGLHVIKREPRRHEQESGCPNCGGPVVGYTDGWGKRWESRVQCTTCKDEHAVFFCEDCKNEFGRMGPKRESVECINCGSKNTVKKRAHDTETHLKKENKDADRIRGATGHDSTRFRGKGKP